MVKIEVEHRGRLTAEKFNDLTKLFSKKAKFISVKKRFSIVYSNNIEKKSVREDKDNPIDLKLRVTNGQPEIALKYGKWSGKDARREFGFHIASEQYENYIEFLKILGYDQAVLMANTKYDYRYHDVEFSLVEVPDWGYYFEAEMLVEENQKKAAEKKIDAEVEALGLKVFSEEEFYDLLDELNNRPGVKIDLSKVETSDLKKKYGEYFQKE